MKRKKHRKGKRNEYYKNPSSSQLYEIANRGKKAPISTYLSTDEKGNYLIRGDVDKLYSILKNSIPFELEENEVLAKFQYFVINLNNLPNGQHLEKKYNIITESYILNQETQERSFAKRMDTTIINNLFDEFIGTYYESTNKELLLQGLERDLMIKTPKKISKRKEKIAKIKKYIKEIKESHHHIPNPLDKSIGGNKFKKVVNEIKYSTKFQAYESLEILLKILKNDTNIKKDVSKKYFSSMFLQEMNNIRNHSNFNQLRKDKKQFPAIYKLARNKLDFPKKKDLTVKGRNKKEHKEATRTIPIIISELQHFFRNIAKISDINLQEFLNIKHKFTANPLITNYKIEVNYIPSRDFISSINDCLTFENKYQKTGINLIKNPNAEFISINTYRKNNFDKTIGRAILTGVKFEDKSTLYVAGFSGTNILDLLINWKDSIYSYILSFAEMNKDMYEGLLFDLNPRNQTKTSHEFTIYIANQLGLVENEAYTLTKKGPVSNQTNLFQLVNPEWKKIKLLKPEGNNDKYFLESVMRQKRNRTLKESPFFVKDEGFVIGKYVPIEELK